MSKHKPLPVKSCEPIQNEGILERELFLCKGVMLDLAASDMKDLADGLMEFHFEDENGREGCFDVSIAEYASKTAAILDSISTNQPAPDTSRLAEALERLVLAAQCRDNSTGDQIRLIETRAELSAAAKNAEEALAAYHKQEAEKSRWHVELIE